MSSQFLTNLLDRTDDSSAGRLADEFMKCYDQASSDLNSPLKGIDSTYATLQRGNFLLTFEREEPKENAAERVLASLIVFRMPAEAMGETIAALAELWEFYARVGARAATAVLPALPATSLPKVTVKPLVERPDLVLED